MKIRLNVLPIMLGMMSLLPVSVRADVTLPKVLASHMVVQRGLPVHVWGWAAAGEVVAVSFRGESEATTADELGRWSVFLRPGAAGGPFELTVKGANSVTLTDVLVGDVWVAGGQSNMEFEMRKAATAAVDLPKAANDRIRLMIVSRKAADYPLADAEVTAAWGASTPETAKEFSAVGWYFAREIAQEENVPVGVIDSTWGGTVAEAWTSLTALGADASLMPVFLARGHMTAREETALLEEKLHEQARAEAKAAGKPEPQFPWHPQLNTWAPAMLWNGMIAPLTPFPIRGVIWYQGESNSALERAPLYGRVFEAMITDWRRQWGIGDFPFLYVQLANFKSTPKEDWATIREAQLETLKLRNSGMAVTVDIGNPDDVHPTDKVTVGHRLALAAEAVTYRGRAEYSGPIFRQVTTEHPATGGAGALRVWFDHAEGLMTKGDLTGFEVAGTDGKFAPATAVVEGETVVLTSAAVAQPVAARYGWENSPHCHLYNVAGLPASPFTSER